MKKTTLSLFTLLMSFSLFGQIQLESKIDQFLSGGTFVNSQGCNYDYDENGNLTTITNLDWDNTSNVFVIRSRESYTYDSNNNITIALFENFDSSNNEFINSFRDLFTYNSNNQILDVTSQDWDGGQFVNASRDLYAYSNNNIDTIIIQDFNGSTFVNEIRERYIYDSNNNLIRIEDDEFVGGAFVSEGIRVVLTYDSSNTFITRLAFEVFDGTSFVEDERVDYTIDSNGNRLSEVATFPGGTETASYTYDFSELLPNANPFIDLFQIEFLLESFPHVNRILSIEENGNTSRTVFNYDNQLTLSLDEFKENKISLYPNPIKNTLHIESLQTIEKVEFYNILGGKVLTTDKLQVDVSSLTSGIYMVKLFNSLGQTEVRKIVKQ